MDDIKDLWPPELIIKNQISQLVFLESDGDTVISIFRLDGQVEIEYLIDAENKNPSTVYYVYDDNLLIEDFHIYHSSKDTISYTTYEYENLKLKTKTTIHPSSLNYSEIDKYFYNENGNLKKIKSSFNSENYISQKIKFYSDNGKLNREIYRST